MSRLVITNGDATVPILTDAGLMDDASLIVWRDILHEGPLQDTGSREAYLKARALHLAHKMGLPAEAVLRALENRDARLALAETASQVELWFEHDLYDQLQLVEVLSLLATEPPACPVIYVAADDHLGQQDGATVARFLGLAQQIGPDDFSLAQRVFSALCADTPQSIAVMVCDGAQWSLPFLKPALLRFLDELPDANGLNRTERLALYGIIGGKTTPSRLFAFVTETDDPAFLGDSGFYETLSGLAGGSMPLVSGLWQPFRPDLYDRPDALNAFMRHEGLALTPYGRQVLDGEADRIADCGIARWWGGTLLTGRQTWRWDAVTNTLTHA